MIKLTDNKLEWDNPDIEYCWFKGYTSAELYSEVGLMLSVAFKNDDVERFKGKTEQECIDAANEKLK